LGAAAQARLGCEVLSGLKGKRAASVLKGLSAGPVDLNVCGKTTAAGAMFHVHSAGLLARLGATGGPLAGRRVFATSIGN
jgi:hypothetical protein